MKKTAFLLILFISYEFIGCTEQTKSKSKILGKKDSVMINENPAIDNDYTNWKTVNRKNIQFKYPQDWRMKTKEGKGNTLFQLTNISDTTSIFFPISIYMFTKSLGSYEKFSKNITYEYFVHETDGKNGNLMSTEPSKFKNFVANDFEYQKNGTPAEIITINGISKYYMLVSYAVESDTQIASKIFNSIIISK
ncbi:MAG TPA: hypothetical protein VMU83_09745 [Hanamia sp.]|nr:hypothetical protein [Hanamia sp.]